MSHETSPGMVSARRDASGLRWLLSFGACLAAGLIAAITYAAITALSGSEYFVLAVAVGGAAAFGWNLGGAKSLLSVPVVAVIGASCFAIAVLFSEVGLAIKDGFTFSFAFTYVFQHPGEILSEYFNDGFLSYFFAIAAVGLAGFLAWGFAVPDPVPAAPPAPQQPPPPGPQQYPGPGPLPPSA